MLPTAVSLHTLSARTMSVWDYVGEWSYLLVEYVMPEAKTIVILALVAILMIVLLKPAGVRLVLGAKNSDLMPKTIPPTGIRATRTVSVPLLTKYDFKGWELRLRNALLLEGIVEAIDSPLQVNDWRNVGALIKIEESVQVEMKEILGDSGVAFHALNNLKVKYGTPSYGEQAELEEELKRMKLSDNPTSGQVMTHIEEVIKKLDMLRLSGANMSDAKKCALLAETLPVSNALWKQLRGNLKQVDMIFTRALSAVRSTATEIVMQDKSGNEKAFAARFKPRTNGYVNGKRACFRCQSTDHLVDRCPLPPPANRVNQSVYSRPSETAFSANKEGPKYWRSSPSYSQGRILDSGSTSHHEINRERVASYRGVNNSIVETADGTTCQSYGIGEVFLQTDGEPFRLENVKYTPDFSTNLISVGQLTKDGYKVLFEENQATVIKGDENVLSVPRVGDLYLFTEPTDVAFNTKEPIDWHARFGHPCESKLKELQKRYPHLTMEHPKNCETCIMAKQRQLPYRSTGHVANAPLELIHTDICESKCTGYDGSRYFVVFVDEYTKYAAVSILKHKSSEATMEAFKRFRTLMEKQLGCSIKKVRSDNGGEYKGDFEGYLQENGIAHEWTVAYCHQQNGNAERTIETLIAKTRSLMYESCLPSRYWPLAVNAATFLYNLSPHSALKEKTPVKVMFPNQPDIIERGCGLHVFGSIAYRWVHAERRSLMRAEKFAPNSQKWIFVGYAPDADAYLLLRKGTNEIIKERNVKIIDGNFPFCENKESFPTVCQCAETPVPVTETPRPFPDLFVVQFDATTSASGGEEPANERESVDQPESDASEIVQTEEATAHTTPKQLFSDVANQSEPVTSNVVSQVETVPLSPSVPSTGTESSAESTSEDTTIDQLEGPQPNEIIKVVTPSSSVSLIETEQAEEPSNENVDDVQRYDTELPYLERPVAEHALMVPKDEPEVTVKEEEKLNIAEEGDQMPAPLETTGATEQTVEPPEEVEPRRTRTAEERKRPDRYGYENDEFDYAKLAVEMTEPPTMPQSLLEPPTRYGTWDYAMLVADKSKQIGIFGSATSFFVPETFEEAMNSEWAAYWKEAQNDEIRSLLELQVYDEVEEESWMSVVTSKWVYSVKRNPEGTIDRFKARLVARGFSQRYGFDYWDTYSPTVLACSIRTFLTVCKAQNMEVHQVDVKTAFLHGEIDGDIYVRPPAPYYKPGKVWKLNKALYGLKQAPLCWSNKLKDVLNQMGFFSTKADPCIYTRKDADSLSYVLIYVDDMLVASKDLEKVEQIKEQLKVKLEIKDLGEISTFLGVDFKKTSDGKCLTMSQERYIEQLAMRFNLTDASPKRSLPPLESIDLSGDDVDDSFPVRNLVGGLLFIANMTRPDISAPVSYLSRFLDRPTKRVWGYCQQVLRYLHSTKDLKLYLGDQDGSSLRVYADASFAQEKDRKSQSGAVFQLAGSTVGWYSKRQKTVSSSTTEAEYIAMAHAMNEALWLQQLLSELAYPVQYPTPIFEDNQPAIAIVKSQKKQGLAKHIDIKCKALQDYVLKGYFNVFHVGTLDQLADCLTKTKSSVPEAARLMWRTLDQTFLDRGVC